MLVPALLQTSLVLWLAQQTLQGGVRPQRVSWGRVQPARGVGVGVQPGVAGALGAMGNRYGTKAMKTGVGRYSGAQLGVGGYRSYGLGSRAGLRQGGYGAQGAYGAALGTAMGTGHANGLGYGQGGKRGYGAGLGTVPGYGALAGNGYHGTRPGYIGGPGNYLGAGLGAGGYGPGLGQGAYQGAAAGKHAAAAGLGQGYGDGATGYLGHVAGNGYGYGNGYNNGHGAGLGYPSELADGAENKSGKREALGTGGYAGQGQGAYGALGAGLDTTGGKYGGAQVPYGNAPVIPTGLEGNGGYPYPAQQLNLGAEGAKSANKYGYGAHLGATQDALREQVGQYGEVNGALGNGYKGVNKGM
uniref:Si:dkeyp-71f10.5 n=1 Tax=Gasterosteus aculeatus TaxID=69293 RepID=G3PK18_GASAC|nr:glycine-rich protein DOT1 isoform X11 [Gasterosteus aculeatus aculeatus]